MLVSVIFFLFPVAAAIAVNATIDDSFGDSVTGHRVNYLAQKVWATEMCGTCAIQPDITFAYNGTYTAATYHPQLTNMNITLQFAGTAIYVFFILANNAGEGITTLTAANFTVDGALPHLFQHPPDLKTSEFGYNHLVFKQENLENANHTLVISSSGPTSLYINFDYAIYTYENDTVPSSSPVSKENGAPTATTTETLYITKIDPTVVVPAMTSNTLPISPASSASGDLQPGGDTKSHVSPGVIVGGVVGGLAVGALLIVIMYFLRNDFRRGQGRRRPLFSSGRALPPY